MTLVLIGSAISIMTNKITEHDAPLYNRDTVRLDLAPLSLGDAAPYYPATADNPVGVLESWSIFGGTPFYLQLVSPDESLATNVNRHIISQQGRLHGEPETLLQTESVRKPERYLSILRALADGKRETGAIADYVGFEDSRGVWRYAERLKQLRVIEEDQPVTEETSSPKRYRIQEPLFRFWFRFLYGKNPQHITPDDPFTEQIRPEFPAYVGRVFEGVCRDALPILFPAASFSRIGGWWDSEGELDVVGLDHSGRIIAGESKFTGSPMHLGHLDDVENRTARVDWTPPHEPEVIREYCLFSRSGFTDTLEETAECRDDLHLFPVGDIITALTD
jgi:AAA+ ATPase superfamily predicted ATPase